MGHKYPRYKYQKIGIATCFLISSRKQNAYRVVHGFKTLQVSQIFSEKSKPSVCEIKANTCLCMYSLYVLRPWCRGERWQFCLRIHREWSKSRCTAPSHSPARHTLCQQCLLFNTPAPLLMSLFFSLTFLYLFSTLFVPSLPSTSLSCFPYPFSSRHLLIASSHIS